MPPQPAPICTTSWTLPGPALGTYWCFDEAGDVALAASATADRVIAFLPSFEAVALARLKVEAARSLPRPAAGALLGLGPAGRRVWFYHSIRKNLPADVREWWDAREHVIRLGVLASGRVEQALDSARRRIIEHPDSQIRTRAHLAWILGGASHQLASLWSTGAPRPPAATCWSAAERLLRRVGSHPHPEHPLLDRWLSPPESAVPAWLQPEHFDGVARRAADIHWHWGPVGEAVHEGLDRPPDQVDLGLLPVSAWRTEGAPAWLRTTVAGRVTAWGGGCFGPARPPTGWRLAPSAALADTAGPLADAPVDWVPT